MNYKTVEEYQKHGSPIEIEKFLNYLTKNNIKINCWQKSPTGQRIITQFYMDPLNPLEPEIRITPANKDFDCHLFNKIGPLYLYTDSKKYVTEMKIVYVAKRHLIVMPPDYLHIKCQRKVPRISTTGQNLIVNFKKNKREYEFPILDISNTGMAFKIDKSSFKYFCYPGDELIINKIAHNELISSIQGGVVYARAIPNENSFRVGINFYDEIEVNNEFLNLDAS